MTIGVGIIGLSAGGGWAGLARVPALRAQPDRFSLVGLAASSPDAAAAAAAAFDVPFATDDPAALAARSDVDLLVITVKVPEHRRLIEAVAGAGKPIYCEWPLANGLAEAERLSNAVTTGFVGLQARSAPPLRYLRDLIADGAIGRVLSSRIDAIVEAPWNGETSARRAYLNDRRNGATMLTIPFGHTIDAMRWVLGDVRDVAAMTALLRPDVRSDDGTIIRSDVPDHIAATARLAEGALASLHYRGGQVRLDGFHWEIAGSEGDLVVIGHDGHLQYGRVRILSGRHGEPLVERPLPDRYRRVDLPPLSHGFAVAHAYAAVADALDGKAGEAPTWHDALDLHRLLDRIERSGQAGRG